LQQIVVSVLAILTYCASYMTLYLFATFLLNNKEREITNNLPVSDIIVDLSLVLLFIAQHSIMSKRQWNDQFSADSSESSIPPIVLRRILFNISTVTVLQLLIYSWRPITGFTLWKFPDDSRENFYIYLVALFGWIIIFVQSFAADHLELFGLKQIYYHYYLKCGDPMDEKSSSTKQLYSHMRHPFAFGLFCILWSTANMTIDRFCLAFSFTLYLLTANGVDEQDIDFVEHQLVNFIKQTASRFPKLHTQQVQSRT